MALSPAAAPLCWRVAVLRQAPNAMRLRGRRGPALAASATIAGPTAKPKLLPKQPIDSAMAPTPPHPRDQSTTGATHSTLGEASRECRPALTSAVAHDSATRTASPPPPPPT